MRKRLCVALTMLLLAACSTSSTNGEPSRRGETRAATRGPNILIIMTDDQREGMGVMPKTRRWFSRGTRFVNAFATTPLCCPSRASILTGLYAHNHGVLQNQDEAWRELEDDKTLPVYLQEAGYRTALVGKYLNGFPLDRPPPGFDDWVMKGTDQSTAYYGGRWSVDGELLQVDAYSTNFIARRGARFIRQAAGPWMLVLTPAAPHYPHTPEPRYENAPVGRWRGNPATREQDRTDKPPYVQAASARLRHNIFVRRRQLQSLMSVDNLVRRVGRALADTGQARDTLAFFMSDNSFTWGDHGLEIKTVPYMDSIRIPLFARWPGHIPAGTRDERLAANIDLAPTIMEAVGLEPDAPMDGRSLLSSATRDRLLTENPYPFKEAPLWAGLVTPERHYIEHYDAQWRPTFHEEYDLTADPWELENVLWDGSKTTPSPDLAAQLALDLRCAGSSCP